MDRNQSKTVTHWHWLLRGPAVWLFLAMLSCQMPICAQEAAAQETDMENQRALQFRAMGARNDKNIFSPLDLPTPNRIRTAAGLPGPDYWQQQVDYQMDVELDTENEVINAVAKITYTNNSPDALAFLWLALEQNIFRDDSLGWQASQPRGRVQSRGRLDGGYDIEYIRMDGQDLTFVVYDTLGRLELPQPVPPNGGQIEFEIAWSFKIPEDGINRHGIRRVNAGKIFQIAQWFPHVCKYDDVHGWNALPYLGQGEFYSDFGSYDIKITAPRGYIVLATGELKNPQEVLTEEQLNRLAFAASSRGTMVIRGEDEIGTAAAIPADKFPADAGPADANPADTVPADNGPLTWHFQADRVRSFAWTSSNATIWDAAAVMWEDGQTVLVQSVYPVEAKSAWSESTQMLRHSLMHYSDKWFRYPYPTAINVNGNSGGMEYPMILFCSGDDDRDWLFEVTSHEIGHTWFPMVVNTDERRHAWMDEGFNTFINKYDRIDDFDEVAYGAEPAGSLRPVTLRQFGRFNANSRNDPIMRPADQWQPNLVERLAYSKPAAGLQYLREEVVGPDRFDAAFKQYIRAWAFKSPQPADFFRCMENGTGMNLDWFWRGWYLENLPLDQAVGSVTENPRRKTAEIVVLNKSEMVMPVTLQIDFEDGTRRRMSLPVQIWHYTNRWAVNVDTDGNAVRQVTVDPDRRMPDFQRTNNTWRSSGSNEESESQDDDQ